MSLGADVASALPEMRAAAESLMVDSCTVSRRGEGDGEFNEATGTYDPPMADAVYSGRCRVQLVDVLPQSEVAGEADVFTQRAIVALPVDSSPGVRIGDVVKVTASSFDPDLLNRSYVVRGLHHKSFATARRLQCEEVV